MAKEFCYDLPYAPSAQARLFMSLLADDRLELVPDAASAVNSTGQDWVPGTTGCVACDVRDGGCHPAIFQVSGPGLDVPYSLCYECLTPRLVSGAEALLYEDKPKGL